MRIFRSQKIKRLLHAFLGISFVASAAWINIFGQEPSTQLVPVFWDGDNLVHTYAADGIAALVTKPDGSGYKLPFLIKDSGGTPYCIENKFYLSMWSRSETPEGPKGIATLYRFDTISAKWVVDTEYKGDPAYGIMTVIPMKRPYTYLGISSLPVKLGDESGTFLVLKRNEKDLLDPVAIEDTGLSKPITSYSALSNLLCPPAITITNEAIIIGDGHSGYFFIFDIESGKFKRCVQLFDEIDENRLKKNDIFIDAILGFQPTPDGKIIIAAREEDLVLHGNELLKSELEVIKEVAQKTPLADSHIENGIYTPSKEEHSQDGVEAQATRLELKPDPQAELERSIKSKFPRVVWWELDPMHGKPARLTPPPPGAEEQIGGAWSLCDFAWRWVPTRDGRIRLVSAEELSKSLDTAREAIKQSGPAPIPSEAPTIWLPKKPNETESPKR